MNNEEKILKFFKNKYKKKINMNTKIFKVVDIDSFEFVNIVNQIQNKLKKNYKPVISQNFLNVSLKKFLTYFK
tara:strand:+ start:2246 stop:2464 length:219 start_codon:yes stop_codon:yes gene_type:complete